MYNITNILHVVQGGWYFLERIGGSQYMESHMSAAYVIDSEHRILSYSEQFRAVCPEIEAGAKCYRTIMGLDAPCAFCPAQEGNQNPCTAYDPVRKQQISLGAMVIPWADGRNAYAVSMEEAAGLYDPKTMGDNYCDVYSLHLQTRQITVYRASGLALGVADVLMMGELYEAAIEVYISANVLEEDRELMRNATRIQNVIQSLTDAESFTTHYRIVREGEIHYCFLKCIRVGDADSFEDVVFGFAFEDEEVKRARVEAAIAPGGSSGKRSILLIENNEQTRIRLLGLLLDRYNIMQAVDTYEGMRILRECYQQLSLILLDSSLSAENTGFLSGVKDDALLASVPVVMIADRNEEQDEERYLAMGATDVIVKPFNSGIVTARIAGIIRMRESAAVLREIEFDDLTGLYTKQAFYHYARRLMDQNPETVYDVVVTDVENFKTVNAVYGVAKGDEYLQYLAECFKTLTGSGLCARYGGDQLVMMVERDEKRKEAWLTRILNEITRNGPVSGLVLRCGVYADIDRSLSVTTICDRAMLAMKCIKHNYNRFLNAYDSTLTKQRLRAQMLEVSFDEAIENEEFVVWYQPKYDVFTEKLVGMEALVRWKRPKGVYVSPQSFVPVFEEDGLITRLDEYVFRRVCRTVRSWYEESGECMPISVNLSRASLYQKDVAKRYKAIVEEAGIPTKYVPLELTESALFHGPATVELTEELQSAGFRIHLDDFGSGFSSLSSLNHLPIDVVKLDKSLIDSVTTSGGKELLRHIIEHAHFMKTEVVAEGVETEEQLLILKKLQCDMIQGFYFSGPEPHDISFDHVRRLRAEGRA